MLRKVCGYSDPGTYGTVCVGEVGHRGKHKLRANSPASLVAEGVAAYEEAEPVAEDPDTDVELGELVEVNITPQEAVAAVTRSWTPDEDDFLNLKGKAYLPARRRIQWMRGEPVAHPDWTIDTETEVFERGKRSGPGRIEDGFAVVRANVYDADGRLISTGVKSEYSENFADFLEKAETGAIARALAVAGYGTESALDLDEGVERDRIADAPVERKPKVSPSAVPGVKRGGKTEASSVAQIRRVAELSRTLGLGAVGLAGVIESIMKRSLPEMPADEEGQNTVVRLFLASASAEEVGALIVSLEAAVGK